MDYKRQTEPKTS